MLRTPRLRFTPLAALSALLASCSHPAPRAATPAPLGSSASAPASAAAALVEPPDPPMPALRTGESPAAPTTDVTLKVEGHAVDDSAETLALSLDGRGFGGDPWVDVSGALSLTNGSVFIRRPRSEMGKPVQGDIYAPEEARHFRFHAEDPQTMPEDPKVLEQWAQAFAGHGGWGGHPWYAFAAQRLRERYLAQEPEKGRPRVRPPARLLGGDDVARLMDTTTGMESIQEALQQDRPLLAATIEDKKTVPIGSLAGPKLAEHPWDAMLRALGTAVPDEPLAAAAPADSWYLRCADVTSFFRLVDAFDTWGTPLMQVMDERSEERGLAERYETQLGLLRGPLARALGPQVVGELAFVGSDPYFREGTDLTVIFRVKAKPLFDAALAEALAQRGQAHGGITASSGSVDGVAVQVSSSADGAVHQHRATVGDLEILSNSQGAMERVLATLHGKHPRLADEPDFEYMLARDKAQRAGALLYLGDRFIAEVVGPRQKILEARRQMALAELLTPGYAALLYGWLNGRSPASTEELLKSGLLEKEELRHADGQPIAWSPGDAARSAWGTPAALTPLVDLPRPDLVSETERDAYNRFAATYQTYWRRYIDPTAVRIAVGADGTLTADVRVLPLIDDSEYRDIQREVGRARFALAPLDSGLRFTLGVGADADVRRDMDEALPEVAGGRDLKLDWLGDWAMLGVEDRTPVAVAMAHDGDVPQRPQTAPEERGSQHDMEALNDVLHLPLYAAIAVRSPVAAGLFLTGIKKMADEAGPGMIDWRQKEAYRDIPIVRIGVSPTAVDSDMPGGDIEIFYAFCRGALLASLREGTLRRAIDRQLDGKGPAELRSDESAPQSAQLAVELGSKKGSPLWQAAGWLLERSALKADGASRSAAEILLRGAPEKAADPAALRSLALAYFGAVPVPPDGGAYTLAPDGVSDPARGTAFAPKWPALPVPGSPVARLLDAVARFRGELSFDNEGAGEAKAEGRDAMQSLHAKATFSP